MRGAMLCTILSPIQVNNGVLEVGVLKILSVPGYHRLVIAGVSESWGVGNGSLNVDDADNGYTGSQRKGSDCD